MHKRETTRDGTKQVKVVIIIRRIVFFLCEEFRGILNFFLSHFLRRRIFTLEIKYEKGFWGNYVFLCRIDICAEVVMGRER